MSAKRVSVGSIPTGMSQQRKEPQMASHPQKKKPMKPTTPSTTRRAKPARKKTKKK